MISPVKLYGFLRSHGNSGMELCGPLLLYLAGSDGASWMDEHIDAL